MNGAQLHLLTNHLPVLGVAFSAALTLAGILRGSDELKTAGLWAFVLAGLGALPAYFSGEGAEHVVKGLPGVARELIHAHEEAGEGALSAALGLGGLALAALVHARRRGALHAKAAPVLFLLAVPALAWLAYTAHLGGLIRHQELRGGLERAQPPSTPSSAR